MGQLSQLHAALPTLLPGQCILSALHALVGARIAAGTVARGALNPQRGIETGSRIAAAAAIFPKPAPALLYGVWIERHTATAHDPITLQTNEGGRLRW